MLTIVLTVLGVYIAVVAMMYVAQRKLMYQPGYVLPSPTETLIPTAEPRALNSEPDLQLVSWFLAPADGMPVIVYFQGNAATIADRDFKVAPWHQAGYGVWLVGYRGYGGNPGFPTEDGLYADARAALTELANDGVRPDQIILYGESLGTGVATQMAWELSKNGTPAKGLVLEAPFSAMGDAAQDHYPFLPARLLVKDKFDSLSKIANIKTPLMIIHGARDRVVGQDHGRRLFAAASKPKTALWLEEAAHNNLYDFGVGGQVLEFFESLK